MKINVPTLSASTLSTALCAAMLAAPAPAAAARASAYLYAPTPVTVRIDDLDIDSPAGARIAWRRIQAAAGRACGPNPSSVRQLSYAQQYEDCQHNNVEALVGAVDAPRVTALNEQRAQPRILTER